MSATWAVVLGNEDVLSLARLRREPGIEVLDAGGRLWVRGDDVSPELELALRALPCVERYGITDERELIPPGGRVPRGTLADGEWVAIDRYLEVVSRPAALPGAISDRVTLRLVRSRTVLPSTVLITRFDTWLEYATRAPECRLRPLAFAASRTGNVLLRGSPLPPIPGISCVARDGLVMPAGYEWEPRVDPEVLRDLLALDPADRALLHLDGTVEIISEEHLVAASRSAVRRTAEALGRTGHE